MEMRKVAPYWWKEIEQCRIFLLLVKRWKQERKKYTRSNLKCFCDTQPNRTLLNDRFFSAMSDWMIEELNILADRTSMGIILHWRKYMRYHCPDLLDKWDQETQEKYKT